MRTKRITTDNLALMLDRQFKRIDLRFEKIDARFDSIEEKLTDTKAGVDRLELRFDKLEDTVFNDHTMRIRVLEKKIGTN